MNKLSLFLVLLGILSLILLLNLSKPIKISLQEELKELIPNQKVELSGKVIKESIYGKTSILILENNITLTYSGEQLTFLNKEITIIGTYDEFNYPKIKILKLKRL